MSWTQVEQVVFLHGIGVGPDSWSEQIAGLPDGFAGFAPAMTGLADDETGFTLDRAAGGVIGELDRRDTDRAHLCGLSLGAVIATEAAIEYPDRVASLMLSGGQVHPPRALKPCNRR